jgi:hypothetical protein
VQVGAQAIPFGPVAAGAAVEWAFEPEKIQELRTAAAATGGRELLDLTQAWLRPPVTGEVSLVTPLCVALLLALLAEALLARTGWRMPELAKGRLGRAREVRIRDHRKLNPSTSVPPLEGSTEMLQTVDSPKETPMNPGQDRGSRFAQAKRQGRPGGRGPAEP